MKPYTSAELRTFVERHGQRLVGGQLQEVVANDRGLALRFWEKGDRWLTVDLSPQTPLAFVVEGDRAPFPKGAKTKPVGLFLNSHARGKLLAGLEMLEEFGRVVRLEFTNGCEVEIRLIPKHPNFIVRAEGKQISWDKVKDLPPVVETEETEFRSPDAIREEWFAEQKGGAKPSQDPVEQWRKRRDRDLEKKRKALGEIEKQLATDTAGEWSARGEDLKSGHGEMIDPKKSRSWNIEQAFAKAKQLAAKREGTEARANILRDEIAALGAQTFEDAARAPLKASANLLKKADVKGRTLSLADDVTVFMGKSGADNLALLRKSRAWDYWLHLRDYPGAHAIIHRRKDQKISEGDLQKAASWLAREAVGSKVAGGRLDVVLVECRHVRPVKGDRIGRVTYHNERHFSVTV